jgi:Mg2+-importing ATPase
VPFDFERRLVSVLADTAGQRLVITKGAPESLLERCAGVTPAARARLDAELASGRRVIALATRDAVGRSSLSGDDERDLVLRGFLVFSDPVKPTARAALEKLARLGIRVKVVTGDNDRVAATVCAELGLAVAGTLVGADVERMTDDELVKALPGTTIFARIAPQQKSRIVRLRRRLGTEVAFLGDGANDAIALHAADVGISVDSAADVAKDAADIVLLRKDLGVLADGVIDGRRIFTNTIKYVLMGTSSNFGNMLSAAGASLFLPFLPMLPTQILLNNLLYDLSELAIPTDRVDTELLERPAHWDNALIRRFMAVFGPISSLYDFATFAVMLGVFHAGESMFHTGWFVESLATQSLVILVIRTRRVPFFRSRPSGLLLANTLFFVLLGAALPFTPLAARLGFMRLPLRFLAFVGGLVIGYLAFAQIAVAFFFRPETGTALAATRSRPERRLGRLIHRWSGRHYRAKRWRGVRSTNKASRSRSIRSRGRSVSTK